MEKHMLLSKKPARTLEVLSRPRVRINLNPEGSRFGTRGRDESRGFAPSLFLASAVLVAVGLAPSESGPIIDLSAPMSNYAQPSQTPATDTYRVRTVAEDTFQTESQEQKRTSQASKSGVHDGPEMEPTAAFGDVLPSAQKVRSKAAVDAGVSALDPGPTAQAPPRKAGRGPEGHAGEAVSMTSSLSVPAATEEVLYQKAKGYQQSGSFDLAIRTYKEVLRVNPDHEGALDRLSSVYMGRSAHRDAYPLVAKLSGKDPANPRTLLNLAILEVALGRPEDAIPLLDRAETLPGAPLFSMYLHKGVALSRIGRLGEASRWYEKSEELEPGDPLLLFNMAVNYDRQGRYTQALRYYGRHLEASASQPTQELEAVQARIIALTAFVRAEPAASRQMSIH